MAGEWYLAIPLSSAAPSVGLETLKLFTARDAELDRLHRGVGLPTRREFYKSVGKKGTRSQVSPYFSMNLHRLGKLVEGAFSRSSFGCYGEFSAILSHQLERMLQTPNDRHLEKHIRGIMADLRANIEFAAAGELCERCPTQAP